MTVVFSRLLHAHRPAGERKPRSLTSGVKLLAPLLHSQPLYWPEPALRGQSVAEWGSGQGLKSCGLAADSAP